MASAAKADRIKPYLNTIISRSQTGYLSERFIGESTRLVYDLMHHVESDDLPGLLVQIDFEKVFDSISWGFLYQVLEYFAFDKELIEWINLFNNDINAFVLKCGNLLKPIAINQGCRQGEPMVT